MKEHVELNSTDQSDGSFTELKIYQGVIQPLFKIIERKPLNGKRKDIRHDLRLRTITLMHLFMNFLVNDDYLNRYLLLIKM